MIATQDRFARALATAAFAALLAAGLGLVFAGASPSAAEKVSGSLQIATELGDGSVKLIITTARAVQKVVVQIYGLDGLVVEGATRQRAGAPPTRVERRDQLGRRDRWEIEVAFTPGPGRSLVAIAANAEDELVATNAVVSVGELSDEQRTKNAEGLRIDSGGQRIKVMQAGPQPQPPKAAHKPDAGTAAPEAEK